jgi:hypothetical protein
MTIKLGNKADGDDFFDRVNERKDLWSYLQGNHIVLSGPRRLGKTSLLQKLADEAEEHGLLARLADMEGIDTAADFIAELDRTFPDSSITGHLASFSDKATSWLNRIPKVNVTLPGGAGLGLELKPSNASWIDAATACNNAFPLRPYCC